MVGQARSQPRGALPLAGASGLCGAYRTEDGRSPGPVCSAPPRPHQQPGASVPMLGPEPRALRCRKPAPNHAWQRNKHCRPCRADWCPARPDFSPHLPSSASSSPRRTLQGLWTPGQWPGTWWTKGRVCGHPQPAAERATCPWEGWGREKRDSLPVCLSLPLATSVPCAPGPPSAAWPRHLGCLVRFLRAHPLASVLAQGHHPGLGVAGGLPSEVGLQENPSLRTQDLCPFRDPEVPGITCSFKDWP